MLACSSLPRDYCSPPDRPRPPEAILSLIDSIPVERCSGSRPSACGTPSERVAAHEPVCSDARDYAMLA